MTEFEGGVEISDELLDAIAGGVLDEDMRQGLDDLVEKVKGGNGSFQTVIDCLAKSTKDPALYREMLDYTTRIWG